MVTAPSPSRIIGWAGAAVGSCIVVVRSGWVEAGIVVRPGTADGAAEAAAMSSIGPVVTGADGFRCNTGGRSASRGVDAASASRVSLAHPVKPAPGTATARAASRSNDRVGKGEYTETPSEVHCRRAGGARQCIDRERRVIRRNSRGTRRLFPPTV